MTDPARGTKPSTPTEAIHRRTLLANLAGVLGALGVLAACGQSNQATSSASTNGTTVAPTKVAASSRAAPTTLAATATPPGTQTPAQATAIALQNAPIASQAPLGAAASTPNARSKGTVVWLVRANDQENLGQRQIFLPAAVKLLPGIKIDYAVAPNVSNGYTEKILAMAAGGSPPDVFGFGQNYVLFWAIGLPQALDSYIGADKWDVDSYFLPGLMNAYKIHGKHYGLSQDTSFGNLGFYNKEMFQQAGVPLPPIDWEDTSWTVDTMREAAQKLTKNSGKSDAVFGVLWNVANAPDAAFLWADNAWPPELYQNYIATQSQLTNPGVTDAYQFKQDLLWKDHVMATPQDVKLMGKAGFPAQRAAMFFGGGWNLTDFTAIKNFSVGVCAVPGKKANKVTNFDDFWIMARASKVKDAAWAFLRLLTNADIAADYAVLTGAPVTPVAANEKWLASQAPRHNMSVADLKKVTLGAIQSKRTQESTDHLFIEWDTIAAAFNKGMAPIYNEGKGPVASLMPGIKSTVDGVLRTIYDRYKDKIPTD